MKPSEKLKKIEDHFKNMNNFGWPEDVNWLIARVKALTDALKHARDKHDGGCVYTEEALEEE